MLRSFLIIWALCIACVFIAIVYHIGQMDGRSDLESWMKTNNVHKFEQLRCP